MTEENTTPKTEATATPVANAAPKVTADAPKVSADKRTTGKNGDQATRRGGAAATKGRRGRKPREPKEFEESIIQIDRVTRVTKGGRQLRFRVSVVIGDQKGRVGYGIGKSSEVMSGVQKAISEAKRNIITVPIFEDTIPHAVNYKFKASKVFLLPAPEGKGVIAGGAVRKVLELAGIKNVLSKMHGSRNKLNSVYATMECLKSLQNRPPYKIKSEDEVVAEEIVEAPKAETPAAPKKEAPAKKAAPKKKDA